MPVFIYSLSDPDTKEVRYVGKAKSSHLRLNGHMSPSNLKLCRRYPCVAWLASLAEQGKEPILHELEETTEADWPARESFWTAKFRREGHHLTNVRNNDEVARAVKGKKSVSARLEARHFNALLDEAAVRAVSLSALIREILLSHLGEREQ